MKFKKKKDKISMKKLYLKNKYLFNIKTKRKYFN